MFTITTLGKTPSSDHTLVRQWPTRQGAISTADHLHEVMKRETAIPGSKVTPIAGVRVTEIATGQTVHERNLLLDLLFEDGLPASV